MGSGMVGAVGLEKEEGDEGDHDEDGAAGVIPEGAGVEAGGVEHG